MEIISTWGGALEKTGEMILVAVEARRSTKCAEARFRRERKISLNNSQRHPGSGPWLHTQACQMLASWEIR
jgi:hypothetical protein